MTWLTVLLLSMLACTLMLSTLLRNQEVDVKRETVWQNRLSNALEFASLVIEKSPVPIRVFNHEGRCVTVNDAYVRLLETPRAQLLADSIHAPSVPHTQQFADDLQACLRTGTATLRETSVLTGQGRPLWMEVSLVPFEREGLRHVLAHFIDITERKLATEKLQQIAFHDALTGLPNRHQFFERLQQALATGRAHQEWGAVLMLDLNRFKQLNDTHGHAAGDELLVEVARRLQRHVRATDVVARLGGDEFTVLLYPLGHDPAAAHAYTEQLRAQLHAALAQPYAVAGIVHDGSASIGCAYMDPQATGDVEALLQGADAQMYAAKRLRSSSRT